MRHCWTACVLLVFGSLLAHSQSAPHRSSSHSDVNVYAGYSYLATNFFRGSGNIFGGENGWNAGLSWRSPKWLGTKVDASEYFSTYDTTDSSKAFTVMGGPEFSLRLGSAKRLIPFADVLVGVAHVSYSGPYGYTPFSNSTSFAWTGLGGLDYFVRPRLGIHVQGGYLGTQFNTKDNQLQQNVPMSHFAVSTGAVVRF